MEKQEVKSILDRLFELSEKANEKHHIIQYSLFNKSYSIGLVYFNCEEIEDASPVLNTHLQLTLPGSSELVESCINLIESHLNS